MRYMEIPADMYLLAMSGSTGLGGGTVVSVLVNAVQKEVWGSGADFQGFAGTAQFSRFAETSGCGRAGSLGHAFHGMVQRYR